MNRPCRIAVKCPGQQPGLESDSPVTNYSSEYTDGPDFPGWRFPVPPPYDPGNPKWWSTDACGGAFHCVSSISQDDADFCAAALAKQCTVTPPPPTNDDPICIVNPAACQPPVPELFPNQTQTASFTCPDGSIFYWTVPAGSVYATSTALANYTALAIANKKVAEKFICLSNINANRCLGDAITSQITATGHDTYMFSIVGGEVPPGCLFSQNSATTALISGIPTTTGVFFFTVRAVGVVTGSVADKTYSISIMGIITDNALTDATKDTAYSTTIVASGGTAPYTFTLVSGNLPTGLTLNVNTGEISGTPTVEETTVFEISVTDSVGATCIKQFSLEVIANTCWIDLATPLVPVPVISINGTGVSDNATGNVIHLARIDYPQTFVYDILNPDGSGYGTGGGGIWKYHAFNGGETTVGPGVFTDQISIYGQDYVGSDTGSCGMIYSVGASLQIEMWNPVSGTLVTVNSVFVRLDNNCVGPDDHFIYAIWDGGVNYDIWIWHQSTGHIHMLGSTHQNLSFQAIANTGHAAFAMEAGALNDTAWFWNGITIAQIYDPGLNVTVIRINASDKIVGLVSNSSFFTWNPIDGLTVIGLPPGAVTGSNIWVTDSGIIIVQANNGSWYYHSGTWNRLHLLLDPLEGWTLVEHVFNVSRDGHAVGDGTHNGNPAQDFWCKLCNPV